MTENLENLEQAVLNWAEEKGILANGNPMAQSIKMLEEVQETMKAVHDNDMVEVKDGIGDVLVTAIILAKMYRMDSYECLNAAYNVIKYREGRMENGQFVKRA